MSSVPPLKEYNHMFTLAFDITSADPTGEHIAASELRQALQNRLSRLDDEELLEALGLPDDTYEYEITANGEEVQS